MTEKQRMVFEFVAAYYDEHGNAPTLPMIARAFQLGAGTILGHVLALIDKGLIVRAERRTFAPVCEDGQRRALASIAPARDDAHIRENR